MVHAARGDGYRAPVLSGPLTPREAGGGPDARGGRRRTRMVHAHSQARSRTCHRQRVPFAPPPSAAAHVWIAEPALSGVLHAEAIQQELRAASRFVVLADTSRR